MNTTGIPTLQADQLNVIAHHIRSIQTEQDIWKDPLKWPVMIDLEQVLNKLIKIAAMRRKQLMDTPDLSGFLASEWKQLDRYNKVKMFGKPVKRQPGMLVLPWV